MLTFKPVVVAVGIVVVAVACAFFAPIVITINGREVPGTPIEVKGETYVPLSALKEAGAKVTKDSGKLAIQFSPAGGANQVAAQEGGLNEWLFDGVWRFRVTSVTRTDDGRPGWKVAVELRNGSKFDQLSLSGSGFTALQLVMADGNPVKANNESELTTPGLAPGAMLNLSLVFYDDEGQGRAADRLLLLIAPDSATNSYLKGNGAAYSGGDPSFRVHLK